MSCGVGRRRSSGLASLWLWYRPAAAAPIQPLARELPYAAGASLKKQKQKIYFFKLFYKLMPSVVTFCLDFVVFLSI